MAEITPRSVLLRRGDTRPRVAPVEVPTLRPVDRPKSPQRLAVDALARFATAISIFTILGHVWLGFEQAPITPIVTLTYAYALAIVLELAASWSQGRRPAWTDGPLSVAAFALPVHITALATAMLLYANSSLWPYLFAVSVALGTKYLIRIRVNGRPRHFLNPSNVGIAVVLILFPWVGIAPPYQYTANVDGWLDWLVPAVILLAGTTLNVKLTGRMPLIFAWLGGFVAQAVVRSVALDADLVAALVPLTGLTLVLYTNYMITDPGTTPHSRRGQIAFGLTNAAIYGLLVSLHIAFGLFFALVLTCILRGGVLFVAERRRA